MLSIKKMISPSSTEAVKGFHVIATARNPAVMQTLAGEGMSCLPLDVTDEDSVVTCQKAVTKLTGGTLDILVNNA